MRKMSIDRNSECMQSADAFLPCQKVDRAGGQIRAGWLTQ
jgi:hypothetical protein